MQGGISRRELLARAGIGAVAVGLGIPACGQQAVATTTKKDSPSWDELRAMFGLDPTYAHLAGLLLASHPAPVEGAIEAYRDELDRNPVATWHSRHPKEELAARRAAAEYLNARAGDIALTGSTTMGLALLYNGVKVNPAQEVLTTAHDHAVTHQSIRLRRQKSGHKLRFVALYKDPAKATADEVVDSLAQAIKPETRVLAATWVHSSTGVKLPIAEMSKIVARANAGRSEDDRLLFCVDGVHGFGNQELDLPALGCDFFAAGCHKWLFGPRGTGILWGRPECQKHVTPTIPSFSGFDTWGDAMTPGGFHSFEHRWALKEAFVLHKSIGQKRVSQRIADLNRHCKEGLAKMGHVTLYTPMSAELSAGIVCFDVAGMQQTQVVERLLAKRVIASVTPYRNSYARLTPSLLNTHQDVDKALAAIRDMA